MRQRRRFTAPTVIIALLVAVGFAAAALSQASDVTPLTSAGSGRTLSAITDRPIRTTTPSEFTTRIAAVSRVGIFTPTQGITVANLTVRPGRYIVSYSFEARFESANRPSELRCSIVDHNGRNVFLGDDPNTIRSGRDWVRRNFAATFSLPDLTLGIRCVPVTVDLHQAWFRDVTLRATKMAY